MKNHDPGPLPEISSHCKHCEHKSGIFAPPVPVIGQPEDSAYFTLATLMCAHLQQRHLKVFGQVMQAQMASQMRFSHLFHLREYSTNDPDLGHYLDRSRHLILRMMQRRVPDSKLEAQVNSLASIRTHDHNDAEHYLKRSDVLALLKEMRDVMQEDGLYPEMDPPNDPARVILASRT